jgi:hypothetical protein
VSEGAPTGRSIAVKDDLPVRDQWRSTGQPVRGDSTTQA